MELKDEIRIEAPKHAVYAALNDPEVLKAAIPGCQELTKLSDTELEAKVTLKVGPVKATFGGRVTLDTAGAPDRFSRLLAGGMTATIFFYAAINLMMVMGLAPVVGIPLPFMSHGGSSMMTNMICIGSLMMVDRWSRRAVAPGFG